MILNGGKDVQNTKIKGFTLAEVLITLTILGIVAMLVVPGLTKNGQTKAKRVKIKKAISVYESVINSIIIENNLPRNTSSLDSFIKNDDECSNAYKYFKTVKKNGCQFQTPDGLWWDVGTNATISAPIVTFKEKNLTASDSFSHKDYKAFFFITKFDNNAAARILDLNYAYEIGDIIYVLYTTKVRAFLEDKKDTDFFVLCEKTGDTKCVSYTESHINANTGIGTLQTYGGNKPYGYGVSATYNPWTNNINNQIDSYTDSKGRTVGVTNICDIQGVCNATKFQYSPQWNDMPAAQKDALIGYIRERYGDEVADDIKWSYGGGPEITVTENGKLTQINNNHSDVISATFGIRTNSHGNIGFSTDKIEGFDLFDW